jgi:hypothetical protein
MTPVRPFEGPWRARATLHYADYRYTLAACDGKADLVFTSPPYCDARTYGANVSWTLDDYAKLGDAVFHALRPGGWALINVDAPVREWRPGFGTERGFHPWEMMLDWAKRIGQVGAYLGRFRNDWEPLLWFQRPGGEQFFDRQVLAEKARYGRPVGSTMPARGADAMTTRRATGWAAANDARHRGSLWWYGAVGKGQSGMPELEVVGHPARWPYLLAEDIVRCFCPPDGLACDPFTGAGTSLVAALDHGRRFIGGDLFERQDDGVPWVEVAERVADARYGSE